MFWKHKNKNEKNKKMFLKFKCNISCDVKQNCFRMARIIEINTKNTILKQKNTFLEP